LRCNALEAVPACRMFVLWCVGDGHRCRDLDEKILTFEVLLVPASGGLRSHTKWLTVEFVQPNQTAWRVFLYGA